MVARRQPLMWCWSVEHGYSRIEPGGAAAKNIVSIHGDFFAATADETDFVSRSWNGLLVMNEPNRRYAIVSIDLWKVTVSEVHVAKRFLLRKPFESLKEVDSPLLLQAFRLILATTLNNIRWAKLKLYPIIFISTTRGYGILRRIRDTSQDTGYFLGILWVC